MKKTILTFILSIIFSIQCHATEYSKRACSQFDDKDNMFPLLRVILQKTLEDPKYGLKNPKLTNSGKDFNIFKKMAEKGNEAAMYNLGVLYLKGKGVEQDYLKGASWILRSEWKLGYATLNNLRNCLIYKKIKSTEKMDFYELLKDYKNNQKE